MRILLSPLFDKQGNYNKEGKKIWAIDEKLVYNDKTGIAYTLYRKDGKPDNPSPMGVGDEYYLYVRVRSWLIPLKVTMYDLIQKIGYKAVLDHYYHGNENERMEAFFKARDAGKASEFLKEEEKRIKYFGSIKSSQCDWVVKYCQSHIEEFNKTKKDSKHYSPSFIGAFLCDEILTYYKLVKKGEESVE